MKNETVRIVYSDDGTTSLYVATSEGFRNYPNAKWLRHLEHSEMLMLLDDPNTLTKYIYLRE